jgi:hypothetical protein
VTLDFNEASHRWLIVAAIVVAVILVRLAWRHGERRRRAWVDSLAAAFSTTAVHESEFHSRFPVTVKGRAFEIAHRHRGGGIGDQTTGGWSLTSAIPLAGVADIYSLRLRRKRNGEIDVQDSGYHPREGWLNAALRKALLDFFAVAPRLGTLDVERGQLIYRSYGRMQPGKLRALVPLLTDIAALLERAL